MLIEFRVENFRSFRDEQILSLVASNDTSLPDNCFSAGKLNLLRCAAVYGPNASGKSNLIEAASSMRSFVEASADEKAGSAVAVDRFRLDPECSRRPSVFEVTFLAKGIRYQYGFSLSPERVRGEWLFAYPQGKAQSWVDRAFDAETGEYRWRFSSYLKGNKNQLKEFTRENALFLSVGAKFNHDQLTPVYEWFRLNWRALNLSGDPYHLARRTVSASRSEGLTPHIREFATRLVREADLGIEAFRISEHPLPDDPAQAAASKILGKTIDTPKGVVEYDVEMRHRARSKDPQVWFSMDDESRGTQRLFGLAADWWVAMALGHSLFVDELDTSLHPVLVRKLIELIQDPDTNTGNAQLVFVTHSTTLMDKQLLRRDQIWFTEKDQDGASHLYSLHDYKEHRARKREALEKGYLAGRYGAVPILGDFDLK